MTKKLEQIRQAIADYMWAEGCSCCQDTERHDDAENRLGQLLEVPRYSDDSGYDFSQFRTEKVKPFTTDAGTAILATTSVLTVGMFLGYFLAAAIGGI